MKRVIIPVEFGDAETLYKSDEFKEFIKESKDMKVFDGETGDIVEMADGIPNKTINAIIGNSQPFSAIEKFVEEYNKKQDGKEKEGKEGTGDAEAKE